MRDFRSSRKTSARCKGQAALREGRRSVDERPSIRTIETANLDSRLKTRIKVVEVDPMLAAGLRREWLPMRDAPAGLATHSAQRLVAPDVVNGIFRMPLYLNRPELIVCPDAPKAPADGTVAPGRLLGH